MRVFLTTVGALVALAASLPALDLSPVVKEAVVLELNGSLSEALDRYRNALSSETSLVQDEGLEKPLTVYVFSKAAHLSIDLGYGEEAWDLSGRLLGSRNPEALEAGTLVRMRLARLEGDPAKAQTLYEHWAKSGTTPSPGLYAEYLRSGGPDQGPRSLVSSGTWEVLSSPSEVIGIRVSESSRIQVGAFKDWGNALTLVEMLKEKGWVPMTSVKAAGNGEKLHVVYVVSRQPEADRERLKAQGLPVIP